MARDKRRKIKVSYYARRTAISDTITFSQWVHLNDVKLILNEIFMSALLQDIISPLFFFLEILKK